MLKRFFKGQIEEASTTARLKEMVDVLRKREVMGGMTPEKLRAVLEDLGPTFVKLGQVMSMRPDFLPPEYCEELMKLQTEALPLPFDTIVEVIEQEYNCRWQKVFDYIDEVALGYDEQTAIAEANRCLNCKNARCVSGCPVGINIPGFIKKVKEGDVCGAYEVISGSSSLPAVCGRVCPQESQC